MSTIDETIKNLNSLTNLPNYALRKVREYCPVDNNVDTPPSGRLRRSFHVRQTDETSWVIESDSPYLKYVVNGRGPVRPKSAKHLRWNAFGHGNGAFYPSHGGTGYFFSGYAKATEGNPFVSKAYDDIVAHIHRMGLKELAQELSAGAWSEGVYIGR